MDIQNLVFILRGALSSNPDERKAAELNLTQFERTPQHLVRLLKIGVDNAFDMAVRQFACIQLKNFTAKHWRPRDSDEQQIAEGDKALAREYILLFIVEAPPLLRLQLGECLKTIIHTDYPEHWPSLLNWVIQNLQGQNEKVCGALFVLRILARKYEFKTDTDRDPAHHIIQQTFSSILHIFQNLVYITSPSMEIAEPIKLICKIFWSTIYLEIPVQLNDPSVFNSWMVLFLNILERPISMENQPVDPDARKLWGWWKVKKWTVHILNRLSTRFGDIKLQNSEYRAFAEMLQNTYGRKILENYLNLLNLIRVGGYLPDRVVNLILQYLTNSVSRTSMYAMLQPHLDVLLLEIVFPLMCFNENDQKLWDGDPHEYVRKGYDIIEDLYSPRTAAIDFVSELVRKRRKENFHKFINFIIEILKRYNDAPLDCKPYWQKDGALLAIGSLSDKLKQIEPYKSQLDHMLVQHVFPEFQSPVGHLRAKAIWVVGQYAHINFSNQSNFNDALHSVVMGLTDPELPVRIDAVFALQSFVEACKDLNTLRPILPQLLNEFFKVMNEVDNEDLVSTLDTIVDKFGEEMEPYAVGLCQNLASAFWRYMNTADDDPEPDDHGALAAVGCLRAISTILESVSRFPCLFVQVEPILLPILRRMLTSDGQDVFEEIVEIVSYMSYFSPTISVDMWSLWPLMLEALSDWAIDYFPNILVPLDNYISRGNKHFLASKNPDYQQSLWNLISSILEDVKFEDGDAAPAPKLISVVFQNCKGKVDQWVESYLRITVERLKQCQKAYFKCLLLQVIADALYYNPSMVIGILQKFGVATEIFNLWFQMLEQVKKSGSWENFRSIYSKKVCCLGFTSLLGLPADQLQGEALDRVFKATLVLLVEYGKQVAVAAKGDEAGADGTNSFEIDDEDDDSDWSDNVMGDDAVNEDEIDSVSLEKLVEQGKSFQSKEYETDDESDDDYIDDDDDDELKSPIDEVNPFIFFIDAVKAMEASDSLRYVNLMQRLGSHYQQLAISVAQLAEQQQRLVFEKDLHEKIAVATI